MQLLFDENLSESVVAALAADFPGSTHVRQLGRAGQSDLAVWALAKTSGYVLVTRDEDFLRLSSARGAPPKVVWVMLHNCRNAEVVELLRSHAKQLEQFVKDKQAAFLILSGPVRFRG